MTQIGPKTAMSNQLHGMKYRGLNENFEEAINRVAFGLADNGPHYHALRDVLLPQRFCPGGRIQGAIGASRQTTAFNCYVSGTIEDSLYEGEGSIMNRLGESAQTSKLGGGIGYDFSPLRPRGYRVKKIETNATGPVTFMEFYNITGLTIASAGHRRGAQMAILRVDHPDVEEFVRAKQKPGALEGFNISVAVTDAFMEAVYADALFPLSFGGIVDREIRAGDLWQKIMRSTWDWAEPGVFYVDAVNRMNNLYYCETIAACNPCGEQPLPPYGACLLGSFNLPKYLITQPVTDQNSASQEAHHTEHGHRPYSFDYDQLKADIPHVVRGMDNVNDRSVYPLAQQREEARSKRRMGLGVMGLANAGEALGHPYGSPPFIEFEQQVLMIIRDECYRASANLAVEKGAFPRYDAERYLNGAFIKTLSEDVYELIKKNGIRNSHLTSIAPTGTISLCADNVSGGIEPVFAYEVERPVNTPDGRINVRVADYGVEELGVRGKLSRDVTPAEHVAVLVTAQRYVDSAVSKTCNVTGACQWDEFTGIYAEVHRKGGKGCTTFNKDGLRGALLAEAGGPATTDDGPSCAVDESGRRSCE